MTAVLHGPPTEVEPRDPVVTAEAVASAFEQLFTLRHTAAAEISFVRHGQPDFRAAVHGDVPIDFPLSHAGREQAMLLATRLERSAVAAVYASPQRCAAETAAYLAAPHGLPVARCGDLRDVSFDPRKVGRLNSCGTSLQRDIVRRLIAEPRWNSLPGFEPSTSFRRRAIVAIEGIVSRHPGEHVLIVTHSSVINAYLSMLLGVPRDVFVLPAHASLSTVRASGDLYAVAHLNDVGHLTQSLQSY